jgi:hypothetical protein
MSSADLLKQVLSKGPVKRTLFPDPTTPRVVIKSEPPVITTKAIVPLDDGFEEEEVSSFSDQS